MKLFIGAITFLVVTITSTSIYASTQETIASLVKKGFEIKAVSNTESTNSDVYLQNMTTKEAYICKVSNMRYPSAGGQTVKCVKLN